MTRRITAHVLIFIFILMLFTPVLTAAAPWNEPIVSCSGAQDSGPNDPVKQKACTICDIARLAQNVLNVGIFIAIFISAFLFAWAGFLLVFGGASPGQREKGKSIFWNVFIGLLVIMGGWVIVDTLMKVLVGKVEGNLGPWNQIC